MIISEQTMLAKLDVARSVLLLEPNYSRKYLPLGLAKIATYLGNKPFVYHRYYKSYPCDLVCISSLFTYDLPQVLMSINEIRSYDAKVPIIVGGICASLMPEAFLSDTPSMDNVFVFVGTSQVLDTCIPAYYKVDWEMADPWDKFSFTFTTRGCPNRCGYCAVWRIEPKQYIVPNWSDHIIGSKTYAMVSDNNLSSFPVEHVCAVAEKLQGCSGVIIDNGLDPKHVTPEVCKALGRLNFYREGMRLSFDRISEREKFIDAVTILSKGGVNPASMMAYCIFNYTDTFEEAFYRCSVCASVGVRPFPQHYTPLNTTNRHCHYISPNWNMALIKAFGYYWRGQVYLCQDFMDFAELNKTMYGLSVDDLSMIRTHIMTGRI